MMKQYFFGGKWYVAVPVDEIPKSISTPTAEDMAESVADTEARIVTAMSFWLWRVSARTNPFGLHLKDEPTRDKRK